ncbi:MAG: hypothetical protein ACPGLV_11960 [Bacteroidia bacterium]
MKVEKLKLGTKETEKPLKVLGVAAALDFYRLAYFFAKSADKKATICNISNIDIYSILTYYKIENHENDLYLIKNHLPEGYFLSKAKKADYLLIVRGPNAQLITKKLKNDLNEVGTVQSIFAIEEKFLSKNKLKYID